MRSTMSVIDQTAVFFALPIFKVIRGFLGKEDRYARNYRDRHTGSGAIHGASEMELQPVVGLYAIRRTGPSVGHCAHVGVYGPDVPHVDIPKLTSATGRLCHTIRA